MQNKKFIIPEYQRPYKWDEEKCEILWKDITDFHELHDTNREEYFLGTIVSYKNNENIEIIDGQQRITSFFLLLRAFYKKLEGMAEDANIKGLKNQISPCIWDIDPISQEVNDKKRIHIESLVATDEDSKIFHKILETGIADKCSKDMYSRNYLSFLDKCETYAQDKPMQWQSLCVTILQKCIILPIECDVQDTALTIFTTLNDRGMPLTDSDIFKAQIYKSKYNDSEKKKFTGVWKDLTSICKAASITLDDVFRYYSHVLRAREKDKTKEVGLRKFYTKNNYESLKSDVLMDELSALANFWRYVNSNKRDDECPFEFTKETKKYLHCLSCYPNEFWKYIISVYFMKNKDTINFTEDLTDFLKRLVAFLFVKFIEKPTVNAIKDDIYIRCIAIQQETDIDLNIELDIAELKRKISAFSSSKLARALVLLHAYQNVNQENLLQKDFEIEHIFPKKWQNTNYNGWGENEAQDYLERFGNKVAIEKKLNIQAGNGYFGNKKSKYLQSRIEDVLVLGKYPKNDWMQADIDDREVKFLNEIIKYFEIQIGKTIN